VPEPRSGEVLVRIAAAAINPSDVKIVSGAFQTSLPRIPGRDFSGTVIGGDGECGQHIWGMVFCFDLTGSG